MGSYFHSPIAYTTMTFFLVAMGIIFYFLTLLLTAGVPGAGVIHLIFGSPFYWMTQMVVVPLLTMRLFAEERRMGTLETLLTAPVADHTVVFAKFAGVLAFFALIWAPTLLFFAGLHLLSAEMPPLDYGVLVSAYFGVLLMGGFFLSIGIFCSISSSNQIIAAIYCFVMMLAVYMSGFTEYLTYERELIELARLISPQRHLGEFSRGIIDTRPVVMCLTGTAFFLFTSIRILDSRQWK